MRCPFLKDTNVRFCAASPYRKMVPESSIHESDQKCCSAAYTQCVVARQHLLYEEDSRHCPFIREALVQYCAAAQVRKFIPYAEGLVSPCAYDTHVHCRTYVEFLQSDLTKRV